MWACGAMNNMEELIEVTRRAHLRLHAQQLMQHSALLNQLKQGMPPVEPLTRWQKARYRLRFWSVRASDAWGVLTGRLEARAPE